MGQKYYSFFNLFHYSGFYAYLFITYSESLSIFVLSQFFQYIVSFIIEINVIPSPLKRSESNRLEVR
jgi:hypothetical protein